MKNCKHYTSLHKHHRHYVKAEQYGNCLLCLAENEGPMSQGEIADYLGMTKMRVSQIQRQAIKKIRKRIILIHQKSS